MIRESVETRRRQRIAPDGLRVVGRCRGFRWRWAHRPCGRLYQLRAGHLAKRCRPPSFAPGWILGAPSALRGSNSQGPVALATGDLDGNGRKDLIAVTAAGETLVFLGDGKGSFTRQKTPPPAFPVACGGAHVELADLDGDGRDEMAESFSDESDQYGHCPSNGGLTAWKASRRKSARRP